jgi:hypothetical protein
MKSNLETFCLKDSENETTKEKKERKRERD